MEIKKLPTLAEKQTFWVEQLPKFESKYWLPSHFDFLAFDMDQGNYVVKDDLDPIYEDDANEIYHRVNTGWAMWKKAVNFTVNETKPSVPEGFVLVPRIITDEWMEVYVDQVITKYCVDYEDTPHYVRENELPELREDHRLPIRRAHERLMQVIEAQEPSNDS